nr:hypothetical protein HUO10_005305 [Paraburkholderia busanensis]
MKALRLRVPRDDAHELADDLTSWASSTGIDPAPSVEDELDSIGDAEALVVYKVYVSDSFFELFPRWRECIEH